MTRPLLLALVLCACGSPFTGDVSGYPLHVRESLFAVLTDANGAETGAAIILSDQANTCASLAAAKAPPDATLAVFVVGRTVDGKQLSPDIGDYTIGASGASVSAATGAFVHTDANGTNAIPSANASATSGLLKVTLFAQNEISGTFDGKFGQQSDAVTAAFSATLCTISTETLERGFIGSGQGPATSDPVVAHGGSCRFANTGSAGAITCIEYTGSAYTSSSIESSCSSSGSFSSAGCSSSNGYCAINPGTTTEYRYTFSAGSDAQSMCSTYGGSFSNN